MGRTDCTEPQCLYSTAIPLLPLWAVRPVQNLSACTVQLYLYSPNVPYSLYKGALYLYLSQSRCPQRCVFSGFHRGGNEICALLRFYASYIASMLPTFRDNLSVQSSRANISKENTVSVDWTDPWRWGPTGWPETSARNYRSVLRKISIEHISHSRPQRFIYARWKCQVKQHKTQHNTKHNTTQYRVFM